jgi:hypothetical protein
MSIITSCGNYRLWPGRSDSFDGLRLRRRLWFLERDPEDWDAEESESDSGDEDVDDSDSESDSESEDKLLPDSESE